jgi:hypothetical protein
MRKHSKKKVSFLDSSSLPTFTDLSSTSSLPPEYHGATLPQPEQKTRRSIKTETTFSLSVVSHITIHAKVELSRKRISLLLEQEIVRVATEGFTLLDYFSFEWMLNYLNGSSTPSVFNLNGNKSSIICYITKLVLLSYRENWNLLYKATALDPRLTTWICENLGDYSDRKYQGRRSIYLLEKFLSIKIENVDTNILERSQTSVRYTSYCKGYGESGHSARRQKTRYSDELDRDRSEVIQEELKPSQIVLLHQVKDLSFIEQMILGERNT